MKSRPRKEIIHSLSPHPSPLEFRLQFRGLCSASAMSSCWHWGSQTGTSCSGSADGGPLVGQSGRQNWAGGGWNWARNGWADGGQSQGGWVGIRYNHHQQQQQNGGNSSCGHSRACWCRHPADFFKKLEASCPVCFSKIDVAQSDPIWNWVSLFWPTLKGRDSWPALTHTDKAYHWSQFKPARGLAS